MGEDRRKRRQRRLEQLEIPEGHLLVSDDMLGRGGFGTVYLADYNGRNAAAKVVKVDHSLRDFSGTENIVGGVFR